MKSYSELGPIIRSIHKWEETTFLQIRNKKWDQIQLFSYNDNPFGDAHKIWLMNKILSNDNNEFTKEMEDLLIRLFGDKISKEGWAIQLVNYRKPSVASIEYFISNQKIVNINQSDPKKNMSLIEKIIAIDIPIEKKIYLLDIILLNGADINTQNEATGNSILLECIDNAFELWDNFYINQEEDFSKREKRLQYISLCFFLLGRGADSLLENKEGISSLSMLKDSDDIIKDEDRQVYSNMLKVMETLI